MVRVSIVLVLLLASCRSVTTVSPAANNAPADILLAQSEAAEPAILAAPAARPSLPPKLPPRRPDEQKLRAMDGVTLRAVLPAPNFERRDGAAHIRQHRNTYCVMDLYFYALGNGGGEALSHIDMRALVEGEEGIDRTLCLESFFPEGGVPDAILADRVEGPQISVTAE